MKLRNRIEELIKRFEKDLKGVRDIRINKYKSAVKNICEEVWEGQLSVLYELRKLKK